MNKYDRELGMSRPISRRDFLNGLAIGFGGVMTGGWRLASATQVAQETPDYYPPALTGMRGSHDGSFEVAHELLNGTFWNTLGTPIDTKEAYDLIVVGGGISGLAAAYFYRARAGPDARVLILDNHDDFGGHAKRNEFRVAGELWIANGGTAAIDSPFPYSKRARALMADLGIEPSVLNASAAKAANGRAFQGLQAAHFFDKETFGEDRLIVGTPGGRGVSGEPAMAWSDFVAKTPLPPKAQRDILRLQEEAVDYMHGLSPAEKKDRLSRMSYRDFLLRVVKVDEAVIPFYQTRTHGLYGLGIDAVGALECWALGFPGFAGLKLDESAEGRLSFTARGEATPKEPYHFHFPDGNATIARLLVRALVPAALPGRTAEDSVTAKVDYSRLDRAEAPVRIRLNSTVVHAKHVGPAHEGRARDKGWTPVDNARDVEVLYAREKQIFAARSKSVVMACWNMVIPWIVPELPDTQKEALRYGVKVPLVYTSVAIRSWEAFKALGVRSVSAPGMYHYSMQLEQPTVIGDYNPRISPAAPILVRMTRTPNQPGLPSRAQHRAGHAELFTTPFSTFERNIREQLARILEKGGFQPARDIVAITVNRWPHGYAYEYNPLWDPDWAPGQSPAEIGRTRFGRIAIANADAGAAAYTDVAMDEAWRAVQELTDT